MVIKKGCEYDGKVQPQSNRKKWFYANCGVAVPIFYDYLNVPDVEDSKRHIAQWQACRRIGQAMIQTVKNLYIICVCGEHTQFW